MTTTGRPDFNLRGQTAIVTGGSYGIGLGIVRALVAAEANVMICARDAGQLDKARDEIVRDFPGAGAATVVADIANEQDAESTVRATLERFGSVDVLVNNASTPASGYLMDISIESMESAVRGSLISVVLWTRTAARAWMLEHGGSVINISSIAALSPERKFGFYGAMKAGIDRLTVQLAVELAPRVRANAIAPGWIDTPRMKVAVDNHGPGLSDAVPLKRLGTPADIGGLAVYLASDASAYVTGTVIRVDGGQVVAPGEFTRLLGL